ncbi:MAG: serine/threonine protein kinase [Deltaproteobacteria bacterium]|nr:serine/threonine protein kinase [Deltaproteobacteria bacterium]
MADSSPLAHSPTLVSTPGPGGERLEHGASVGEYLVEGFLGAGAMGEVYAGIHPVIGKKVAIKILKREVGSSPDGAERFKREARAVNQIDHPNVIDIFSFGRIDDGRLYLVMDLVEGRSLRKALADGSLDVDTALDVLAQIADALDAAHARGVVHRDLKPDNVMLGSGAPPKVYVLDFGLAKLVTPADAVAPASMLTGQGTWLGTPGYMAPEQWSADGAGPASDRYSLGVMAFELLSGSLPFQATSLPQMMEQHFRAKVPALSTRGAIQARSTFDPVVSRAMAKDPEARFPSAREMVEALRAAAGKPGRKARPAGGTRSWVPVAAGVAVLGLSIAVVVLVRGGGTRADDEGDRRPTAAPVTGKVRIEIYSHPQKAEALLDDDSLIGLTPTHRDLEPGSTLAFRVRKPGYATVRHTMTVPDEDHLIPAFVLEPVNGFEGVWALPGGELRAFQRTDDDRVAVSKLLTVTGNREFYRHYLFAPADRGAVFAYAETMIDPDAANEPSCHIPQQLVYTFDPVAQTLILRREEVIHDLVGGKCVKKSSSFAPPESLTRVDVRSSTDRATLPPAGLPSEEELFDKKRPPAKPTPKNAQVSPKKPGPKPPVDKKQLNAIDGSNNSNQVGTLPRQNEDLGQQAPTPQAPPPQAAQLPTQKPAAQEDQKVAPRAQANQPPPRGDSQVAPIVQQKQRKK